MKLIYDGQIFRFQKAGGINRYFAEIISRLPAEWQPAIIGVSQLGANAPAHKNLRVSDGLSFRPRRVSRRIRPLHWRFNFLRGASILHPTYYNLCDGLDFSDAKCPVIITVYDMVYAHYASILNDAEAFLKIQREAILRADRIVCISQATETDLLTRIPQAAGKTSVIHLASSFAPNGTHPVPRSEPAATFLYVGLRGTYKNFSFLLNAFAAAAESFKPMKLIIAGPPLTEHERWQIHGLGIGDLIESHVFPNEEALKQLYRSSLALLYPSLYEGFGIPPLEAMTCGAVAVTSNTTSLPEVVGDGGIMLDPTDKDQWVQCMLQLARGTVDRDAIIARGRARAARFSWAKTAEQHVQLYQNMAAGS